MSDKAFRRALGEFATGVAVVTAQSAADEPVGMTLSSFNSVSADPPLVLFSVAHRASSLPAMLEAKGFGVNVLARDQEDLADRFARSAQDRWLEVQRSHGHAGAPLIAGSLAHLECEPYARYEGGDHAIFVVRVVRHTILRGEAAPLIFFRGRYWGLTEPEGVS